MKIGIISHYYKSENYGGNLQSYALCAALHKMGYDAEQISFDRRKGSGAVLRAKLFLSDRKKAIKSISHGVFRKLNQRSKSIYCFNQNDVPHSLNVYSSESIRNCVDDYDAFITGSDQVWHPSAVCDEYLLGFVPESKIKLSYAASIACNTLPDTVAMRYKRAFATFNAISLRENDVIPLIEGLYRGEVSWALDPTLLLDSEDWRQISSPVDIKDDYLFCYFLGENKRSRELACEYAKEKGLKIVTLPHLVGKFVKCDKDFGDYKLYDVSPNQLVSIIDKAKFVFTDSFHATVFSLILNKEFCVFSRDSKNGMESRINSLLSIFEHPERFCNSDERARIDYIDALFPIDYNKKFETYEKLKSESLNYLKSNIDGTAGNNRKAIKITNPSNCCGCYACVSACPKGCIKMKSDDEGFWYPVIDENECISCGLCKKACPILSPFNKEKTKDGSAAAYAARTKNEEIRKNSSSGGIFTEIAEWVIAQGGVVCGAAFDDDFNVNHVFVDNSNDLYKLRGSKYVQSAIGNAYKEAESYLKEGKLVLFSGTPCQIGGLYSYLKRDYENLITQDIICHGTPSPAVWQEYLRHIEKSHGSKVKGISFRDKRNGWRAYCVRFDFENGKEVVIPSGDVIYMKGFLRDLCLRPSCYQCSFKQEHRESDFTLADFWGIDKLLPEFDDNKGTSLVFVNSIKAENLFNRLDLEKKKISVIDDAINYNLSMIKCPNRPIRRERYIADVLNSGYNGINDKYFKVSRVSRIKNRLKRIIKRLVKG